MTSAAAAPRVNGIGRHAALAVAPYDDPMSRVLGLDAESSSASTWVACSFGALGLMVLLIVVAQLMSLLFNIRLPFISQAPQEIEVSAEEQLPPPPPPKAEVPESKPEPAAPPPPRALSHDTPPPPPPAPAQAGKVLAQEPDPNEPVDLTGNTIVTGNADEYAGGTTSSNGTSKTAVQGPASPTGVPGGTGPVQAAQPAPQVDRSRAASLAGGGEWSCPFPPEADTAQIDEAYVTLQVDVRADGSPAAVHVLSDPGNGFGREAYRCAMGKRYTFALDSSGNAIAASTRPFRVHFSR